MIADKLTDLIVARLNQKYKTFYVPLDSAFPTSGKDFIRVCPADLSVTLDEQMVIVDTSITITCSTRIRDQARENEYIAHKRIVNFAEQIFFWLLTYNTIRGAMMTLYPLSSVTDRITSKYLDLRAVPVTADYYDAKDIHERKPAGFKVDQTIMLPRLHLPLICGELNPAYFDFSS